MHLQKYVYVLHALNVKYLRLRSPIEVFATRNNNSYRYLEHIFRRDLAA